VVNEMHLAEIELLEAYRRMRTIRVFEENIKTEFEKGNIPGFVHLYVGQEASAVGVCLNLLNTDYIGSTHRGHGHCIAKGCDVTAMMCEIYGRRSGLCAGKGGSMHIADFERGMLGANAIVGGNPPLVIGAALSAKTLSNRGVAVSFTGDGGSNQGTTFESMNMAVVLKLPAIFVFENNGYGENTSHDFAVGSKDIAARAAAFGMPALKIDGTDFFAVYEATRASVDRARAGGGPSAIETVAPRWHGHFMGDPQAYRSTSEREKLQSYDPIAKFRRTVVTQGRLTDGQLNRIDAQVAELVAAAIAEAASAPYPPVSELQTDVYSSYV
jgi:acetoin:2,6-dichlorophenolindophenol oxidoreductase subunit alpha